MRNLFHANSVMSSIHLARGYTPSAAGVSDSKVPDSMLKAHVQTSSSREIQKLLRSKTSRVVRQDAMKPNTKLFDYL